MSAYRIELFVHVAAVIVALGATFSFPLLHAAAERQGVPATRFVLRTMHLIETRLVLPGAVLIFLMGLALIFNDRTGYSDHLPAWLAVAIIWYLAAFFTASVVQRANVNAALGTLEGVPDGSALPSAYRAAARRVQLTGAALGLTTVGIAFLMVWKPGA